MRTRTMRTMILALAVILLAAPVWAVVYITATDEGGGVVRIDYNSVGEPNLPRAFGLDITVKEGIIVDCCDYAVGDDNFGYGIFPGTFGVLTVNAGTGMVETWDVNTYTPVSAGLDTNWVTIEMGSLYDLNAPGDFGTLCRVVVSSNPALLSIAENFLSGGVVMEDANGPVGGVVPDVNVPVYFPPTDCFPSGFTTYADWVRYGKPDCWCAPPEGSGYQCDGDGDGLTYGYQKYRVFTPDLTLLVNNWKRKDVDIGSGNPELEPDPCADFDHKLYGYQKYRVFTPDLTILVNSWKMYDVDNLTKPVEERLPGDCGTLARPE